MTQTFKINDELPIVREKRNAARKSGDYRLFTGLALIHDDLIGLQSDGFEYAAVDDSGNVSGERENGQTV